jgi:MoxR-like ATPase
MKLIKAPRDFPNDLLFEIENMSFSINELMNKTVSSPGTGAQVLVIMTSNFEKNLPDAFLRRCLFYHIPFPDTENLMKIVSSRLQPHFAELYKNDAEGLEKVNKHLPRNIELVIKNLKK